MISDPEDLFLKIYRTCSRRCLRGGRAVHGTRHPLEMGQDEVTRFLSALAVHAQVSASTPHQALCALLFLYREVLVQELGWLKVGLAKPVSCYSLRHACATHLLEDGYDIRTMQELLGHRDVRTTTISTHVLNRRRRGVQSPVDRP